MALAIATYEKQAVGREGGGEGGAGLACASACFSRPARGFDGTPRVRDLWASRARRLVIRQNADTPPQDKNKIAKNT